MTRNELTVVWTGRFQPTHVGHLAILQRSFAEFDMPHAVILTTYYGWSADTPYAESSRESYEARRNPLTMWERLRLMRLAVETLPRGNDLTIISAPRHDLDWQRVSEFYPPQRIIALTAKDEFENTKELLWRSRGERVHVFRDMQDVLTTTEIRRRVNQGEDWRAFLPEATWSYFEEVDGPSRVFDLHM